MQPNRRSGVTLFMTALRIGLLAICTRRSFLQPATTAHRPWLPQGARPGVDKTVALGPTLPPPLPGRYEPGIAPDNEEKGLGVGQIVSVHGGQQAQKEKEKKEQAAIEADLARQRAEQARQRNVDEKISSQ